MRFNSVLLKILLLFSVIAIMNICAGVPGLALDNVDSEDKKDRFNMSYIYFGNTGRYTEMVDNTQNSLDDISPSYFDIEEDGSLKITTAVDRGFIADMHERGVRVTPFLSNHWDRASGINALNNRERLASQIVSAIDEYELDGVNVDIENVTVNEREAYVDFIRLLREKLPNGKSVSVAVAVNPYGITGEWQASYDYASLAQYSDYLMLMAYDEHYEGDVTKPGCKPGPIAGFDFVEDSIKAALKEVPSDKLVLGIPFYGRLWKRGDTYGGYGISNYVVEEMVKEYGGKIIYDYKEKSPRAVITIDASDRKPVISGKRLEAGTYDIWFENEASIKRKLELVEKYNLKGTGSWSLGQETKDTWDYYAMWLNGIYFDDVQSHWAKPYILAALDMGWMNGMSKTRWMPDAPMTRAQVAALFVRILGIDASSADANEPVFTDIAGHWASAEIDAAYHSGLVEGIGGGKFAPEAVLTREQVAVMLNRIMKLEEQPQASFRDVTPSNSPWSCKAISAMAAAKILEGFPDGTFRPKNAMSRAQMAALMQRSWRYLDAGFSEASVQK